VWIVQESQSKLLHELLLTDGLFTTFHQEVVVGFVGVCYSHGQQSIEKPFLPFPSVKVARDTSVASGSFVENVNFAEMLSILSMHIWLVEKILVCPLLF
jgi:hypothetical protein